MILGLPLPPAILQPPVPIAPSHVEDFSLSRLGSSYSLSRARFFPARRRLSRSPVAPFHALPSPLTSSCHLVRLLFVPALKRYEWPAAPHTRKRKTFSLHVPACPSTFLSGAFIDRVSLCVDALSRAVPRLPPSFCIFYTACSSIVCPRVVIYADVATHADRDLIYVKRILKAKKDVT